MRFYRGGWQSVGSCCIWRDQDSAQKYDQGEKVANRFIVPDGGLACPDESRWKNDTHASLGGYWAASS